MTSGSSNRTVEMRSSVSSFGFSLGGATSFVNRFVVEAVYFLIFNPTTSFDFLGEMADTNKMLGVLPYKQLWQTSCRERKKKTHVRSTGFAK